ncbi:phosphotransferase family protein [Gordonia sp. TBRC 11910]|uniref:Phosphotransferase family protein n=1 Tax=Gordonia asplenii TaxID=2725283 RepID=A0A848L6H5_9ACTN|nr:phosphotransferase family protein [Gordonia asplenii]NMO03208.1 phosphotransferase family protein [Gordonia asplenii]
MPQPSPAPAGVDVDAVSAWFADNVADSVAPLTFTQLAGGRSNLTYRVGDAEGNRWVLRRPPLTSTDPTAHSMAREWSILSLLASSPAPTPAPVALCDDPAVTGALFYVMAHVPGIVLAADADADVFDAAHCRTISDSAVQALVDLHQVDCTTTQFDEFRRSGSYLERQLRRWSSQIEKIGTVTPDWSRAHRLLVERRPAERYFGVVHGDFRLGNLLVDRSGAVTGILDWELWSLGDVLADLGWLVASWSSADVFGWAPTPEAGFCTPAEVISGYERATGFDAAQIDYYHAFALWRLACIAQGVLIRYTAGAMGDTDGVDMDLLTRRPAMLAERALDLLS